VGNLDDQRTSIFLGEAQRGSDPEDVAVEPAFPNQDARLYTSTIDHERKKKSN
jgi:hypothetical protein